ncbi:radical SAM protein [Candidatus Wolfebacteria bacterium]|nr:radical SAM protein [Candidatus Wolfebacteria bacterium]
MEKQMTAIIKVVGDFCNLRCKYCFYHGKNQSVKSIMKFDLLEKFITEYMTLFSNNLFIWHGGEPLLAGINFFEKVMYTQQKFNGANRKVKNTIQTNATLITDDWAKFFKANKFGVGVSLDGNEKSHNRFRVTADGNGTFDKVIKGIEILRRNGIHPGIIQTLTRANISDTEDNFRFFTETLGLKGWGTNFFYQFSSQTKIDNQKITNAEMIKFLKKIIDLWLKKDDSCLRIREIENFSLGVLGKKALNCTFNSECDRYFCVDYDGLIYPCDRKSGNFENAFGNLKKHNLKSILGNQKRLEYVKSSKILPTDCLVCEWKIFCNNGCTANREGGENGKFYYCEARKEVFSYLREKINSVLKEVHHGKECDFGFNG